MAELGIEAEPVLANSKLGDMVPDRLPAATSFDHVFVKAAIAGETLWLDGTGGGARLADIYDTPIEELDLSTRTYNCLKRADITKVGQVLEMDEKALLSVRNLGQKSMEEIRDKLIERGYIPRSSLLSATNGTEPSE